MKKILFIGMICCLFVSCKNKELSKITLNEDLKYIVNVYGCDEEDFFEPVQGTYALVENEDKLQITIEFVKTKQNISSNYTVNSFILEPENIDEQDIKINEKYIEFQAEDKQLKANELLKAAVGDKIKITFSYIPTNVEAKEKIVTNFATCSIDLELEENEDVDAEISTDESEQEDLASSTSSQDWDELLNAYEQYVDKYIACVSKAANGDINALSEYADLMEAAEEYVDKMENAQDDMTAAQWARYMKITNKMTAAAAKM